MDSTNFYITSELNKILICLQLYGNQSIYKKRNIFYRRNMIYYITVSIIFEHTKTSKTNKNQQRQKFYKKMKNTPFQP